jgi:hypothetical protein
VFGTNPDGGDFLSIRLGYGLGGGVNYNPNGTSPGYGQCDKDVMKLPVLSIGGYGEADAGLGPAYAGLSADAGVNVEYQQINPYWHPGPEYGLDWGWSLRATIAGGIEGTLQ